MGLYRSEKLHYLCHQIRSLLQLQLAFEKKQTNKHVPLNTYNLVRKCRNVSLVPGLEPGYIYEATGM